MIDFESEYTLLTADPPPYDPIYNDTKEKETNCDSGTLKNLRDKLSRKTTTEKRTSINTAATLSAKAQTHHTHHEDRKSAAKITGIGTIIEKAIPASFQAQNHHKYHDERTAHKRTTGIRAIIGNVAITLQAKNYR